MLFVFKNAIKLQTSPLDCTHVALSISHLINYLFASFKLLVIYSSIVYCFQLIMNALIKISTNVIIIVQVLLEDLFVRVYPVIIL